ncbi:Ger(x)C family spore germination protein [Bacillus pseudomycoides]|uniref:Ger(x)C family spore germination protein n=1 Tax=Bacillus pseudomycoides TaxID=64104 RepID=UPI000BF9BBA3|nr:Ger(x)C family spore germination protein [Bacillus pseudomycoides]
MNSLRIRYMLFIPLIILLVLLSGCWSRIELNNRVFITAVFIDKAKGKGVEMTLMFPLTNRIPAQIGGSPSKIPYATVSATGLNMAEAYRFIQSDLPRQIAWEHNRVIVLGRDLAEAGVKPVLEFINRNPNAQLRTLIMVAPGKAKEISKLTPVVERFPNEVIRQLSRQKTIINSTVKDFLMAYEKGGDTICALLTIGKKKLLSEQGEKKTWVGSDGAAIFKNGKMVGTINMQEMRGAQWIMDRIQNALITVPSPTDKKPISLLIDRSKTNIKPSLKGNHITFEIKTAAVGHLISSDSNLKMTDPKQFRNLERIFNSKIEGYIQDAMHNSRKLGADVFQLDSYLDWHEPQKWRKIKPNWHRIYKYEADIKIKVQTKIKHGAEKNPV